MADFLESTLERSIFAKLMEVEFGIALQPDNREQVQRAFRCLRIFDNWQEFYEKTGWRRDNPEMASKAYLTGSRICRRIGRKIWYFSRIEWEDAKI